MTDGETGPVVSEPAAYCPPEVGGELDAGSAGRRDRERGDGARSGPEPALHVLGVGPVGGPEGPVVLPSVVARLALAAGVERMVGGRLHAPVALPFKPDGRRLPGHGADDRTPTVPVCQHAVPDADVLYGDLAVCGEDERARREARR